MDLRYLLRRWPPLLLLAPAALAHDIEAAVRLAPPAAIVRATYGGAEPLAFAKVQVFAPGSPASEFQTGVTDRRGCFSFVPDQAGVWRVVVDDEEGHRREVTLSVPERFEAGAAPAAAPVSRLERALTGVALLFGATGVLYGIKARRSS